MIAAVFDEKLAWYISRSSGLLAWVLCGLSIVWGLALSTRFIRRRGLPAWLLDVHTFLGGLAVVFTGVHLVALVADNYTVFGWRELFVPMASEYRPGAVAWGIVAFYLLIAIELTSLIRKRLSRRVWHTVHLTSFGVFGAGTLHGIQAGSDWSNLVVKIGSLVVGSLVIWWTALRILRRAEMIQPIVVGASSSVDPIELLGPLPGVVEPVAALLPLPAVVEHVPAVPEQVRVTVPEPVFVAEPLPVTVQEPMFVPGVRQPAVQRPSPVPVSLASGPGLLPPDAAMSFAAAMLASPASSPRQAPHTGPRNTGPRNTGPPVGINVVFPAMKDVRSADQDSDARVGAAPDDMRQAGAGSADLPVSSVPAELTDQLDDLSQGTGAERLALAQQSARGVDPTP